MSEQTAKVTCGKCKSQRDINRRSSTPLLSRFYCLTCHKNQKPSKERRSV